MSGQWFDACAQECAVLEMDEDLAKRLDIPHHHGEYLCVCRYWILRSYQHLVYAAPLALCVRVPLSERLLSAYKHI